jgi:hypothetical protein
VLGEAGGRMLQVVPEFYDADLTIARIDQLAELSLKHGIPTTFSPVFDSKVTPKAAPRILARVEEQFARGARVWPLMQTRPIDISFSMLNPSLFLARLPTWRTMRQPLEKRLEALADPATIKTLIAEAGPTAAPPSSATSSSAGRPGPVAYVGRRVKSQPSAVKARPGDQHVARERPRCGLPGGERRARRRPHRAHAGPPADAWARATAAPSPPSRPTATPATCSASSSAARHFSLEARSRRSPPTRPTSGIKDVG